MTIFLSNHIKRLGISLLLGLLLAGLTMLTLAGWPDVARAAGPICTVNSGGGGGVDYTTIQAAINDAGCLTINITTVGTHNESLNIARSLTINGAGKTSTIIDRGGQSRVITVTGAVVHINNLRVTGGNADVNSPTDRNGGGILVTGGATLHAENLQIDNNIASNSSGTGFGGGLAVVNSSAAYLTGTMIASNVAHVPTINGAGQGGGLYVNNSTLSLVSSQIMSNSANTDDTAGLGGGLFANANAHLTLYGNTWQNNVAHNNVSGDVEGNGGAVAVEFTTGTTLLTVTNDIFTGNTANAGNSNLTGSDKASGGAIFLNTTNTGGTIIATLNNVTMTQNIAKAGNSNTGEGRGGAIFARHTKLAVQRANIYNNQAAVNDTGSGGGIYIQEPADDAEFTNSIVADNTALGVSGNGAQLYISFTGSLGLNNVAKIAHLTVADKDSNLRQGIWYDGDSGNQLLITNTIVTSHTTGIFNNNGNPSEVNIDYILYFGNTSDSPASVPDPANKVMQNPQFINPAANNYHLSSGSPAIDAGLNGLTIDIDGDTRPYDGDQNSTATVDIGADEFVLTEAYLPIILKAN